MKVICIDDDWSAVAKNSVASLVLKVGDPMPEKDKEYEVIGYSSSPNGSEGYELFGLDYSNYPGGKLLFKKERFKISDETFIPNCVYEGMPARKVNMYCSFHIPIKSFGKMPRKKKKMFKKYGMSFTHPRHKLSKQ